MCFSFFISFIYLFMLWTNWIYVLECSYLDCHLNFDFIKISTENKSMNFIQRLQQQSILSYLTFFMRLLVRWVFLIEFCKLTNTVDYVMLIEFSVAAVDLFSHIEIMQLHRILAACSILHTNKFVHVCMVTYW